jgi:hypothetical protein
MTKRRNRSNDDINTPLKKQKTSKNTGGSSDSEQSGGSSDILVTAASNQDLIVSVREATTSSSGKKVALLSISNNRPDTNLGKAQGDHVTAYRSFLEMLMAATEGSSLRKTADIIAKTAKSLIPGKAEKFDEILENIEKEIEKKVSAKTRCQILQDLKDKAQYSDSQLESIKEDLKSSKRAFLMKVVERIGQEFIKQINLDEETAFKKEGPADKGEGARVKKAIHALKAINDLKALCDNNDTFNETRLNRFYKKFIKVGSPYKDGANEIFGEGSIKELNKYWGKKSRSKAFELRKLYYDIDKEKIGKLFGDLFDFKYSVHSDKSKPDTLLCKVVAKHIVTMFHAFDELQSFDDTIKGEIIDKFLQQEILEKQEWNNLKIRQGKSVIDMNLEFLKQEVNKYLNFAEYRMFSDLEMNTKQKASGASKIQGKGTSK